MLRFGMDGGSRMTGETIAVLGAGNGGFALTADLGLDDYDVRLYSSPDHDSNLQSAKEAGGITVEGPVVEGTVTPDAMTTDPATALEDASTVFIAVPAYGHRDIIDRCLPHVPDGATIALVPGYGSAALVRSELEATGRAEDVTVAEAAVLPYACRITGPGSVRITARFKLLAAADPSTANERAFETLERHFGVERLTDVVEVLLTNPNPVIHPLPAILNTGERDRSAGEMSLYADGMTPSVQKAMFALDDERRELCRTLGYLDRDLDGIYELFGSGPVYRQSMGTDADRFLPRFITEDVPYGLRLWIAIGAALDIDMPVTRAITSLAEALWDADYMETGRTLESIGIDPDELTTTYGTN